MVKNEKETTDNEKLTVNQESTNKKESTDLSDMPTPEGDEEVKLLSTLPILLAQIKTGNN